MNYYCYLISTARMVWYYCDVQKGHIYHLVKMTMGAGYCSFMVYVCIEKLDDLIKEIPKNNYHPSTPSSGGSREGSMGSMSSMEPLF